MPWIAKKFQMPDLVAGAWLGGTLDTSASVVAAGALISDAAMKTGVIVKFSQNALIGVAAFILVVWWAYKARAQARNEGDATKTDVAIIWERFPKFVLGFLAASVLFSFFLPGDAVNGTRGARPWSNAVTRPADNTALRPAIFTIPNMTPLSMRLTKPS